MSGCACELAPAQRIVAHAEGGYVLFAEGGHAGQVSTLNEALQWLGHDRECARAQVIDVVRVRQADSSRLFALESLLAACCGIGA